MTAYYNEIDSYVAQWLRNLIAAGHIAPGDVDERSIVDVRADDLVGYEQCHFFAGIGGWSYALRLAGWDDIRPVWTGSCPCQPLSSAGQRKGHADERHLWPAFYSLIAERSPAIVFGEQVASADGREWLAGIRADLETLGYACGAADLCAASSAAPHVRARIFWLADAGKKDVARPQFEGGGLFVVKVAPSTVDGHGRIPAWLYNCSNPLSVSSLDGFRRPVGEVGAFGNAIVPQVAAEFIRAAGEAMRTTQP